MAAELTAIAAAVKAIHKARKTLDGLAPDIDRATTETLLEGYAEHAQAIASIQRQLQERDDQAFADLYGKLRSLTDRIEGLVNVEETTELILQTIRHHARTTNAEKHRLMNNVLVNGIERVSDDAALRRHFVRMIAELELDHVRVLRFVEKYSDGLDAADVPRPEVVHVRPGLSAIDLALIVELQPRGMTSGNAQPPPDLAGMARITPLGRQFLAYLREPPTD